MVNRRELLYAGAGVAAVAAARPETLWAARGQPGTLLILGGTGFIGPHLTQVAQQRGWRVTHFNRGRHEETSPPGVETLLGDRNGSLEALQGRRWDAVIDNTGYVPKFVKHSCDVLARESGYLLYVSSISAYASFAKPNDEDSPLNAFPDPQFETVTATSYGPMKALCERYVQDTFGGRQGIVRPGYIVGPLDTTDRFTYWPVRYGRGGEMLAPGNPADPVQIIDVRDLATWMMQLVEARTHGIFNAVSEAGRFTIGDVLHCSQLVNTAANTPLTWVPEEFLRQQWRSESVALPPWAQRSGDTAASGLVSMDRARRAGLRIRPLLDTTRDTLAWFRSLPAERQASMRLLLEPQKEADTLAAWHLAAHAG